MATLSRQRDVAYLPNINTWKQIPGVSKNEETETHVPNERTEQNSRKKPNKMEASNLPDTGFKTLAIRMLDELRERTNELSENLSEEKEL